MSILTRLKCLLRIIYYTFVMYVVTHIIVFFMVPFWFVCTWLYPDMVNRLKERFGMLLLAIVNKQVAISGLDKIRKDTSYVIIANYPSFYTGFILMSLFPNAQILVHAFISRIPLVSYTFKRNGFIFARRKGIRKIKQGLRVAVETSKNNSIIILPEGKRTQDGQIHEFKKGFIYILRNNSMDVLPVTLNGFYKLKPVNRHYLNPDTSLEVIFHSPFRYSALEHLSNKQIMMKIRNVIGDSYKP